MCRFCRPKGLNVDGQSGTRWRGPALNSSTTVAQSAASKRPKGKTRESVTPKDRSPGSARPVYVSILRPHPGGRSAE